MRRLPLLALALVGLAAACRSTTGHRRLGVNVIPIADIAASSQAPKEELSVTGAGLSLEYETTDQLWMLLELGGRRYDFDGRALEPRSLELGAGLLLEVGRLNAALQPYVEGGLRCSDIYGGVGEHWSADAAAGLRYRIGAGTHVEFGLGHAFSIDAASFGREFDGPFVQLGLLFDL